MLSLVGPLILALVLGVLIRHWRGVRASETAGTRFAAKTLLRLGVVLLGVRLDVGLLVDVGILVLIGSLAAVGAGIALVEVVGRRLKLPKGLRLALAVGSGVCGASAILAATSVTRINDEEAGIAVGVISLVGTVGVVCFALVSALAQPNPLGYGFLVGLTLQEVGQVVAAGYASSAVSGDAATIAKLARVAMLAPTLLLLAATQRRAGCRDRTQPKRQRVRTGFKLHLHFSQVTGQWGVPPFLLGFLAMAALQSFGLLPPMLSVVADKGSIILTAAAMAGLGLGIEFAAFRKLGPSAITVGFIAFAGLVALAVPFASLLARS